jgi:hypothetical protein
MIIQSRHQSPFLAQNMLGDPDERDLFVYVPPAMRSRTAVSLLPTCCTPRARPPKAS